MEAQKITLRIPADLADEARDQIRHNRNMRNTQPRTMNKLILSALRLYLSQKRTSLSAELFFVGYSKRGLPTFELYPGKHVADNPFELEDAGHGTGEQE